MGDNTRHAQTRFLSSDSADPAEETRDETIPTGGPTRREFIANVATSGAGVAIAPLLASDPAEAAPPNATVPPGSAEIILHINGANHRLIVEPRVTLLDALRERRKLTGTKKGCDHGQCGACTVLINGRRTLSCLTLAIMHQGEQITTIEGLAQGENLHPMQAAFIEHDAFQCGYCTSGQILSAVGLVREGHAVSEDDIREQMSGNICRCGAYANIVTAIREVMEKRHAAV